jgi:hypothetical protein
MKTTAKQFKEFKDTFTKYQKLLGLTGTMVHFRHEMLDDVHADICVNSEACVAVVRYNKDLPDENATECFPSRTAKHEVIHLLTDRLENCAYKRFTSKDEIKTAVEDIANRLEDLI